jgi:TATA-box binding protein (TBP) (component of TFIID and TFIIIB)
MKVNIAVFQSGKVLLTGAHSMEQIDTAFDFVMRIANKHRAEICKPPLPPMPAKPAPTKRVPNKRK